MPKQKKKMVVAASAPYATSVKTNDTNEGSSVNTGSQNSESLHCEVCTTGVDYIVQCEKCDTWYYHTCVKVPEQLIELMADCNEAHWFCHKCNDVPIEIISNFGKPDSLTGVLSPESYKSAVDINTTTIKHFDQVVLDTRRQMQELAQHFQVVPQENAQIEVENIISSKDSIVCNNLCYLIQLIVLEHLRIYLVKL